MNFLDLVFSSVFHSQKPPLGRIAQSKVTRYSSSKFKGGGGIANSSRYSTILSPFRSALHAYYGVLAFWSSTEPTVMITDLHEVMALTPCLQKVFCTLFDGSFMSMTELGASNKEHDVGLLVRVEAETKN